MRSIRTPVAAVVALLALAASANAADPPGIVLARVAAPTQVAARDGVAVWGAYSVAQRGFTLMRRTATGRVVPVRVPPINAAEQDTANGTGRTEPRTFEVTLGRDAENRLTAVYPRCTATDRATCKLALATLATGQERIVDGTEGALRGAISGARVAWVVATSGGPDRMYARDRPRGRPVRLRRPPLKSLGRFEEIVRDSMRISSVDLRQREIAYVLNARTVSGLGESQLWLLRNLGAGPLQQVAVLRTGGASSGTRQFLQPRVFHHSIVTYIQGRDQTTAVFRYSFLGRILGSGSIGIRDTRTDISGGQFDRGRFLFSPAPYQGIGCSDFEGNPPGATCPILDSGPLRLNPPAPHKR